MRRLIDGNEAIARGALAAGCRFFAGYPITPATGILTTMMAELPRLGGTAVQGEDEIASIGMCIGASVTGEKVLTATSGPGLALYSENIGLAIALETPIVIVDCQRHGPSTGAATKTGQGDIQFVRWGHSGGYPIIALAPESVEECYTLTPVAFNLAEKFRTPVFVLIDKELSLSRETVDIESLPVAEPTNRSDVETTETNPYCFDDCVDIPPFVPLDGSRMVRYTGSAHDECGELCGDNTVLGKFTRHYVDKIDTRTNEIALFDEDLEPGADTLVVSYGIVARSAREAVRMARLRGRAVSHLVLKTLWPVPEQALCHAAEGVKRILVPENNYGLYRREIERLICGPTFSGIQKADATLVTPAEVLTDIESS